MLGLRGFPDVQGGVEKHAEHLCPLLVQGGCDVEVLVRSTYQHKEVGELWRGVRFRSLWAPRQKGLEAIVHTFLGVLYAAWKRPDVLHIHAIGPALMTPLARLLGLRVVVTHHGSDYDRQKWGTFARSILRLGEYCAMRFSNQRIVISRAIQDMVKQKYHVDVTLIPNGVCIPPEVTSSSALTEFGLEAGKYVLLVSRLVPEKRHLDLIAAFNQAGMDDWKLVLVGASDHPDEYVTQLQKVVGHHPAVVMTGYQSGLALQELYTHAGLFVLPSSHEGLPIALLEALSYGLPVLASDIPANVEVGLDHNCYYPLGDIAGLVEVLRKYARVRQNPSQKQATQGWVKANYDWNSIANKTLGLYQKTVV
jgi:glycosyltransferase involved in cell wall biosynthesis